MKLSKYYTREIVLVPKWLGFIIQVTRMWYRFMRSFITPHPFCWYCRDWIQHYGNYLPCIEEKHNKGWE